ncbi:MAG: TonB-dependent receptor [bacterium]
MDVGYGYLDAEFDDYARGPGQDFSGNKLARSPENTLNLSLSYSGEFRFGAIDARIGYSWHDKYYFEPDNNQIDPNSEQSSEGLLDASMNFSLNNGWSVLLWGRNLSDERYRRSVLNAEGEPQRTAGIEPRTVGIRVTKEFWAN